MRRERNSGVGARLEMAPMIDVVFLLLVFFVVTIVPRDVLSQLNVTRPQAAGGQGIPLLRVDITSSGYLINGRLSELCYIEDRLGKLMAISPRQSLIVACASDSDHADLVKILNVCERVQLRNVSLFSVPGTDGG